MKTEFLRNGHTHKMHKMYKLCYWTGCQKREGRADFIVVEAAPRHHEIGLFYCFTHTHTTHSIEKRKGQVRKHTHPTTNQSLY